MNQMLINVATRKFARSVRLPEETFRRRRGHLSKSAVSRRFVALSAARMKEWMACDLSGLDLLVIQIDGIHMDDDLILVAAIGVDAKGDKHPLGLAEGATENAATAQALIDNLVERGLTRRYRGSSSSTVPRHCPRRSAEPRRCRGDPALSGPQGPQHHGTIAQITARLGSACVRQAWEMDDADKAERLIRNLAQRLDGLVRVSSSILKVSTKF